MSNVTIALVGNPNVGKSTLFNNVFGGHQQSSNWAGVTLNSSSINIENKIEIIDLPGIYSFSNPQNEELVVIETLKSKKIDVILNVVDTNNLERNLYLTSQLLELHIPMVIVANMIDILNQRGIHLNLEKLSNILKVPVIALNSKEPANAKAKIVKMINNLNPPNKPVLKYPKLISEQLRQCQEKLNISFFEAIIMLGSFIDDKTPNEIVSSKKLIEDKLQNEAMLIITTIRYEFSYKTAKKVLTYSNQSQEDWGYKLDNVLLNKWLAIPIFLFVMYIVFALSIILGSALQEPVHYIVEYALIDIPIKLLNIEIDSWFGILIRGVGGGISLILGLTPVILILYVVMALLEDSGYMARTAFIMDKIMRYFNIPGNAIIPIIIGFGCNVPGIMATRTLLSMKEKISVAMIVPFSSCSARLIVYTVFCAAFFQENRTTIIFSLYLIGIVIGLFSGLLASKLIGHDDEKNYLILELPRYHLPHLKTILIKTYRNTYSFVYSAGKLIIVSFFIINILTNITINLRHTNNVQESAIAVISKAITPLFKPIGIDSNNWPAVVGIVSGILAKEVVIATLDSSYKSIEKYNKNYSLQNAIVKFFGNKTNAFAYMLFILLYFPCISTFAAIKQEIGIKWAIISVLWSYFVGYLLTALLYALCK